MNIKCLIEIKLKVLEMTKNHFHTSKTTTDYVDNWTNRRTLVIVKSQLQLKNLS